ncbi:MAG: ISL3 family transposase [Acidobacteriota bacterium]
MQLKTILNRVQRYRSFVYGEAAFVETWRGPGIEVAIKPRANGRAVCSGCERPGPGYDTLPARRFEFVPVWGFLVFFVYVMRRVDCARCGVTVEKVPWATGKKRITTTYAWFLATWAKRMTWTDVATAFRTSWDTVFRAVETAVSWGRARVVLTDVRSIGVDEISLRRGHRYLTLVYQIDEGCRRLLWVGEHRQVKTLLRFFRWFGRKGRAQLRFVCSDMWKPYVDVIARRVSHAVHVLDRFHIMAHMGKAIDEVRAGEARKMKRDGYEPLLKDSRWCLLKRPENLTEKQEVKLSDLLLYNLKSVRAYLLKEDFQGFWEYVSPAWAGKFLDRWCTRTMRSQLEPMKKVARMLRNHRELILNWFRAKGSVSAGAVEGLNGKAKVTTRRSYGFRTFRAAEVALYHTLGKLPEPAVTHRFC